MSLFRRSSTISCYYCLSRIDPYSASSSSSGRFDPSSFRCPYCGCWNRYDSHGQIIGDEPAMHDERLNVESFSRRGLPDRNHLPSLAGQRTSSPFCRICQTNQTLLINLRAAYLPDPADPLYAARLEQLPAYIASLQSRYPPVCPSCQPAVDAEIARKDEFARTRALAGALKATSRPPSRAGHAVTGVKSNRTRLRTWRIRGVLWTASYIATLSANAAGLLGLNIPLPLRRLSPLLPLLVPVSVSWTFWDPTYSLQQTSQAQGRKIRVGGRQRYIFLQSLVWISRLVTAVLLFCSWLRPDWDFLHLHTSGPAERISRKQTYFGAALVLELSILILSYFAITIHKPVPIRLIDTSAHRALAQLSKEASSSRTNAQTVSHANGIQPLAEPELFSTLSLSSNPVITPGGEGGGGGVNPMFGQPSLAPTPGEPNSARPNGNPSSFPEEDEEYDDETTPLRARARRQRDPDAMDWEPASPFKKQVPQQQKGHQGSRAQGGPRDDGTWLRQQRFFPPEEPTGLEGLLMRTRLLDEDGPASAGQRTDRSRPVQTRRIRWGWVYGASVLPVVAVLISLWLRSRW